jgi:hypothetical protein
VWEAGRALDGARRRVRVRTTGAGVSGGVFFLFSNRLGCLGSVLVSALLTALVILVLYR